MTTMTRTEMDGSDRNLKVGYEPPENFLNLRDVRFACNKTTTVPR